MGGTEPDSVFYYRIHSPVILIEFDHQRPANLRTCRRPDGAQRASTSTPSSARRTATTTARTCCASTTRRTHTAARPLTKRRVPAGPRSRCALPADREPAGVEARLGGARRLERDARGAVPRLDADAEAPRAPEAVVEPSADVEAGGPVLDRGGGSRRDRELVVRVRVVVGRRKEHVGLDLEESDAGEQRPVEGSGGAGEREVEVDAALRVGVARGFRGSRARAVQVERMRTRHVHGPRQVAGEAGVADENPEPAVEAHLEGQVGAKPTPAS